jgi:hypothetical protein
METERHGGLQNVVNDAFTIPARFGDTDARVRMRS